MPAITISPKDSYKVVDSNGKEIKSDTLLHAGDVIKNELDNRGWKQTWLADKLGIPATRLSEIIKGKKVIPASVAVGLEEITGISALYFLRVQSAYEIAKVKSAKGLGNTP